MNRIFGHTQQAFFADSTSGNMTANLDSFEKDLQDLLAKIDNVKGCLLGAVDAIKKAKSSISELPSAIIENEDVCKVISSITENVNFLTTVQNYPQKPQQGEQPVQSLEEKQSKVENENLSAETTIKEGCTQSQVVVSKEQERKEAKETEAKETKLENTKEADTKKEKAIEVEIGESDEKETGAKMVEKEEAGDKGPGEKEVDLEEAALNEAKTREAEVSQNGQKDDKKEEGKTMELESKDVQQPVDLLESLIPWSEQGEMLMKVASPLLQNGVFWCIHESGVDLNLIQSISQKLRTETMHHRELWKCDLQNKDQIFCVLSKLHNIWLRAIIEKELSESDVVLRYIDTGKTEKVPRSRLNRLPDSLKDTQALALRCCFSKDLVKIPYEVKWQFKDITERHTLAVNIEAEVSDSCLPRYLVSMKKIEENAEDIKDIILRELKESGSQKTSSLLSQDVRIYGEKSSQNDNISIVRDLHRSDAKNEEKVDNAGNGEAGPRKERESKATAEIENNETGKLEATDQQKKKEVKEVKPQLDKINVDVAPEGLSWAELCKTPDANNTEELEFPPLEEFEENSSVEEENDKSLAVRAEEALQADGLQDTREAVASLPSKADGSKEVDNCELSADRSDSVFEESRTTDTEAMRQSEMAIEDRLRAVSHRPDTSDRKLDQGDLSSVDEREIAAKVVDPGDPRKISDSAKSDGGVTYSSGETKEKPEREARSHSDSSADRGVGNNEDAKNQNVHPIATRDCEDRTGLYLVRFSRSKRNPGVVKKEDLYTQSANERNIWLKGLDRGLNNAVFEDPNTRFFVRAFDTRSIEETYRTSRFQIFPFPAFNEALTNIRKSPVVLFVLRRTPNEGKRLCAVAIVASCPYSFSVLGKDGVRREVGLFDVQFLCKAAQRTKWVHTKRSMDELDKRISLTILEQYKMAIQQGNVEKLLDLELQMREPTGQRSSGPAPQSRLWKPHQGKEPNTRRVPDREKVPTEPLSQSLEDRQGQSGKDSPLSLQVEQAVGDEEEERNFSTEPSELWSPTPLTEKQMWTLAGPVQMSTSDNTTPFARNDVDGSIMPSDPQLTSHLQSSEMHRAQQQPFPPQPFPPQPFPQQQQPQQPFPPQPFQQQQQPQQPFPQQHQQPIPPMNFNRQLSEEEKLYMYHHMREQQIQFMLYQQQQQQQQQVYQQNGHGPGYQPSPMEENWDIEIHQGSMKTGGFTGSVNDLGSDDEAERDLRRERDVFDLSD